MSAAFLVIDILIAAIVLRYTLPALDGATGMLVVIIGVAVILWKLARDFV